MKIINLSYSTNNGFKDPRIWLRRIDFITGIFAALAKHHEVIDIHFIDYEGESIDDGVRNVFMRYKPWQLLFPIRFHWKVRRMRPDVVFVQGLIFPLQVCLLRLQLGRNVRLILQHHAERPLRFPRSLLQRISDRYIDGYLFAASGLAKDWVQSRQINKLDKVVEVMGASSVFRHGERNISRARTRVKGAPVYLWVGRLDENKDPRTVIKAFLKFLETNPQASLYVIFQRADLLNELKALIEAHPFGKDSIVLLGHVDHSQLGEWYNSADFFISGSHYEGSGIALCEAMSCGCIPLVTNIPSFHTITGRGAVGFSYSPGDIEALFQVLHDSVAMDIDLEKRRVLDYFEKHLSFNANARKYMETFKD